MANLLKCSMKDTYDPSPFLHLRKGTFPDFVEPSPIDIANYVTGIADKKGLASFAKP